MGGNPAAAPPAGPTRGRPRPAGPASRASEHAPLRSSATAVVDAAEPLLAGHYPGFPIFPGVCLVDHVHRTALATNPEPGRPMRLREIETVRFVGPVFPGDALSVQVDWTARPGGWVCAGVVASPRGRAATVRLRYATEDPA